MLLNINTTTSILDFIKTIRKDLVRIFVFSIIVGFISQGRHLQDFNIPIGVVALLGTALSLLLAFRTGQAYDRWWEARMIWGAIVNDSRTLIRQLLLFLPEESLGDVKLFARRQALWCFALSENLRRLPFSSRVLKYMEEEEIVSSKNVPNAILALHSIHLKEISKAGAISEFREVQVDSTLLKLCDSMGKCERIKSTIFPMSYDKLIHLIIYLFAFLLPFSLNDDSVLVKTILTAIIPLVFIVIERTAIIMQDPFENMPMDTPMTTISRTIEMNLMEMVGEDVVAPEGPKEKYYFIL